MNVLFYTSFRVSEQKGGTERITSRIAQKLREKGFQCYAAYRIEIEKGLPLPEWDGEINISHQPLDDYILNKHIDVVVFQKMTRDVTKLYQFRRKQQLKLKIISVLHFNPGYEEIEITLHNAWKTWKRGKLNIKNALRLFIFPIYKLWYPQRNKELYKTVYQYSDHVVLLSKEFISEYSYYCGLEERKKFAVIPNALSYNEYLPLEKITDKKQQALIVSRLEETQKRISLAIKVWAKISHNINHNLWTLKIVGSGASEEAYKKQVRELGLTNITFCGRQEPKSYYEESSIFLMTSSYEGWGLTLTEAQQFGCVPIAFNSFSSLKDIVTDNENGFIIEDKNIGLYAEKLEMLMNNKNEINIMAQKAINSSHRFDLDNIINLWINLFQS